MQNNFDIQALILKALAMLVLVLSPIHHLMVAVSALVVLDFVTGVWAALKRSEKISSNKMKRSITKAIMYQIALVMAFIVETYLIKDVPVIKVVAGLIGLTEAQSLTENIKQITGVDHWATLKALLNKSLTTKE